jgi:hypothetical protein
MLIKYIHMATQAYRIINTILNNVTVVKWKTIRKKALKII